MGCTKVKFDRTGVLLGPGDEKDGEMKISLAPDPQGHTGTIRGGITVETRKWQGYHPSWPDPGETSLEGATPLSSEEC